jgi:arylsulfatase A-like enzyme/tetratricopeptide (TPR) repeat protein
MPDEVGSWSPLASVTRIMTRALSLGLLVLAAACSRRATVFPRAPVVLISIDTLRADHLPAYGYRGVETPNLEALRRDSLVFENALTHVPLTLPSHASLLTGLLPFEHGVRDNLGYRLSKNHVTLATFLRGRGYATGAAISAVVLEHGSGIAEGFDFYDDAVEIRDIQEPMGHVQRSGWQTEQLLEEWIERQPERKPLFAFLHLYEPHTPYDPPEPFKSRYRSRPYDGEIAATDAMVGRFLDFLKRKEIYDRALILLLSDHGEGLGEHSEDEHGIFLYRSTIWVPLFLKLPGSADAGRRVPEAAQIDDVFPTVCAVLGEKVPPGLSGVSLWTLARQGTAPRRVYSETLYPRFHFGWSDLAALTDDRYEYVEAPKAELYDWRADPAQTRDLSVGLPPAFRSMRIELSNMNRTLQAPGATDPDTIKKLASLGYISAAPANVTARDLPDPKDRIHTIDRLKEASRLAAQHREEEAIALLREQTEQNPLMLDVWETYARTLRRAGRPREALEALVHVDRLSPGTPQILLALSDISLENRDFRKARSFVEAARVAGATNFHGQLAAIALAEGNLEMARTEALAALSQRKTGRIPRVLLARIEQQNGKLVEALNYLEQALELERKGDRKPLINLRSTLGDILARMGREKEAEEAFRSELSNFPENLDAWSLLAVLYASQGRVGEFRELLNDMTRRVPTARSFDAAARIADIVGDKTAAREWRKRKGERFPGAG